MFGARFARRRASQYRRRGLDRIAQRMVEFITDRGVDGASVLEIGGGVGEIQIELLRRGAASAVNLELVDAYDAAADSLLAEAGLSDRAERRVVDIAATPGDVEAADIVVLHRVVCCYPDYEALLSAAAAHTRRVLVFSHPPRNPGTRAVAATQRAIFHATRKSFRSFAHPPDAMLQVIRDYGLSGGPVHRGIAWHVEGLERVS